MTISRGGRHLFEVMVLTDDNNNKRATTSFLKKFRYNLTYNNVLVSGVQPNDSRCVYIGQ